MALILTCASKAYIHTSDEALVGHELLDVKGSGWIPADKTPEGVTGCTVVEVRGLNAVETASIVGMSDPTKELTETLRLGVVRVDGAAPPADMVNVWPFVLTRDLDAVIARLTWGTDPNAQAPALTGATS